MFGSQCATGYIDLLEHVLLVGGLQHGQLSFFAAHIYIRKEFTQVQRLKKKKTKTLDTH